MREKSLLKPRWFWGRAI